MFGWNSTFNPYLIWADYSNHSLIWHRNLTDYDSSEVTIIHPDANGATRVNWSLWSADPQNMMRLVTGLSEVSFISSFTKWPRSSRVMPSHEWPGVMRSGISATEIILEIWNNGIMVINIYGSTKIMVIHHVMSYEIMIHYWEAVLWSYLWSSQTFSGTWPRHMEHIAPLNGEPNGPWSFSCFLLNCLP